MSQALRQRTLHYLTLGLLAAWLGFTNLGGPSLWDIDEGNNSEAAREMLESGNWVVPTFNFRLRVDKPALLYWLQIYSYQAFGINEFSARFPSAIAFVLSVLAGYELARRMFDPVTGLLAGVILASSPACSAAAHFANPDALLNLFTLLALGSFWSSNARTGRSWFVSTGIFIGFAVLAKGPVGFVLPMTVIGLYLLWTRQLCRVWDRRAFLFAALIGMVALPWYVWVAADTKGQFIAEFISRHNVGRFLHPMENHRGPVYYYLLVIIVGAAPWSVFLGASAWFAVGRNGKADNEAGAVTQVLPNQYRFLWSWIMVYLLFFSFSATKLPNYVLPVYAPLAILTARFLDRWRRGLVHVDGRLIAVAGGSLMLMGAGLAGGLLYAGGALSIGAFTFRPIGGLAPWAALGGMMALGGVSFLWLAYRRELTRAVAVICTLAVLIVAFAADGVVNAVETQKGPRRLVEIALACQPTKDVRVGAFGYFQPSLVFYCRREVQLLHTEEAAVEFLQSPLEAYLFLPATAWDRLRLKPAGEAKIVAQHYDLYRRYDVVVVKNR